MVSIALDGPAGAGKSTIAKVLAKRLGFLYVDTGALYRAIGKYAVSRLECPEDAADSAKVEPLLKEIHIALEYSRGKQRVILNGEDVTAQLRTPEMSAASSRVSAIPAVRAFLLRLQRDLAKEHNVIMDGRDIGTVVLPDATVKVFLTASPEARARRRYKELAEKGTEITYEEVLRDMEQRDYADTHREAAPLKKAEDAVEADTTALTLEESVELIASLAREKAGIGAGIAPQ